MATRSRRDRTRLAGSIFSAVLILFVCVFIPHADAAIECQPSVGYDGLFKIGQWAPATISLTNSGDDFDGELEVIVPVGDKVRHVYSRAVSLPGPRSTKDIRFLLYFPSRTTNEVIVRIRKGREVAELARPPLTGFGPKVRFFVTCDDQMGPRTVRNLNNFKLPNDEKFHFVNMQPRLLPDDPAAYGGINGVCLGDMDPSSVPLGAQDALKEYVYSGGNLVVFTGNAGQRYRDTWVEELLPVEIAETVTEKTLTALEQSYGRMDDESGIAVANSRLKDAPFRISTCFPSSGLPLIVIGDIGLGKSTFVAFDPDDKPFELYRGTEPLLVGLFSTLRPIPQLMDPSRGSSSNYGFTDRWSDADLELDNQIREHPSMAIPNFTFIGAFLVLYVIILGPVNYLILRKKKRLELAWLTVPAIVLVFSAGAYTVGRLTKGNETVVHCATLARGSAGVPGLSFESYFGLFSPGKTSYTIKVEDGDAPFRDYRGSFTDSKGMRLNFDDGISMPRYGMNMWTMDTFATQGYWVPPESIGQLEGRLILRDGGLYGGIRNDLGFPVEGCVLTLGNGAIPGIGSIKAGDVFEPKGRRISAGSSGVETLAGVLKPTRGQPHERNLGGRLVSFVDNCYDLRFNDNGMATLWGWVSADSPAIPPISVGKSARREGATLLSVRVPIEWESGLIPAGVCQRRISERTGDVVENETGLLLGKGTLVLEFQPPDGLKARDVRALDVNLNIRNPSNLQFSIAIYNWSRRSWRPLPPNGGTVNKTIPMGAQPQQYFSDENSMVRIRIVQNEERDAGYFGQMGMGANTNIGGSAALVLKQIDLTIYPKTQAETSG